MQATHPMHCTYEFISTWQSYWGEQIDNLDGEVETALLHQNGRPYAALLLGTGHPPAPVFIEYHKEVLRLFYVHFKSGDTRFGIIDFRHIRWSDILLL